MVTRLARWLDHLIDRALCAHYGHDYVDLSDTPPVCVHCGTPLT